MKRILLLFFLLFLGNNIAAINDVDLLQTSFQAVCDRVILPRHPHLFPVFQRAREDFNNGRYFCAACTMDTIADYAQLPEGKGKQSDRQLAFMASYMRDKLARMHQDVQWKQ